jgi:methionine biosynthesis protein MetW
VGESVYDTIWAGRPVGLTHRLVAGQVPHGSRVLDVGSAGGYVAEYLRDQCNCSLVCLDHNPGSVEQARARGFEARRVDLDTETISGDGFDVVLFADVLEHLRDPAETLRQAHGAKRVVVSLPNVAHWSGRAELLAGRFPKKPHGLFDATHLQFFTRRTMRDLVAGAAWSVVNEQYVGDRLPGQPWVRGLHRLSQPAARQFPSLFAYQVVLTLEPATTSATT